MLIFRLKKKWYEKIRSGEKTIEYREVKPYWTKRIRKESDGRAAFFWMQFAFADRPKCILRLGYTKRHMTAEVTEIEIVDGKDTDLHIDKPVYAIHLANVRGNNASTRYAAKVQGLDILRDMRKKLHRRQVCSRCS